MYEVYYIGGPWDMTKKVFEDRTPKDKIEKVTYTLEQKRAVHGTSGETSFTIITGHCFYEWKRVAVNTELKRDIFAAIFQGWND